jgi:signal transduction histidine kinase
MRLPAIVRTTPFRLTLLFLALFAAAAAAFLAYIYIATAGEVTRRTDAEIQREMDSLMAVYTRGGIDALNQALIERAVGDRPFLYLLAKPDGKPITGNLSQSPVEPPTAPDARASFRVTDTDPDGAVVRSQGWGRQVKLPSGELLFVGADIGPGQSYAMRILHALWGAAVLVIVLGMLGGLVVSRNVSRSMAGLNKAVSAVASGDLHARVPVRGVKDEYDELANGLNAMLDRVERLMGGLRHAGDAIAHDLRSPLTRLRVRLESALMQVEAGKADPTAALAQALEDTDAVLRTFNAVLAISRLQAAGQAPNPVLFDASEVAAEMAELYEPVSEEKGLDFKAEFGRGLTIRGDREFVGQALANLLDNAVKYTP